MLNGWANECKGIPGTLQIGLLACTVAQTLESGLTTPANILKLLITLESETPFLDIYAKEIITDTCNN